MEVPQMMYPTGDPVLVDTIIGQLKSQGTFDQFRKECIADVDTKPAYQNLQQRVESTVAKFLENRTWRSDLNKNQLRDSLRKHIHELGFLEAGMERIVDQVVNPKVYTVFMAQVEDVVYGVQGIPKPDKTSNSHNNSSLRENSMTKHTGLFNPSLFSQPPPGFVPGFLPPALQSHMQKPPPTLADLLPTDLDPVSPESGKDSSDSEHKSPERAKLSVVVKEHEDTLDSQLSGFSDLTSHGSERGQTPTGDKDTSDADVKRSDPVPADDHDTHLSKVSSNSRLSFISSDENSNSDDNKNEDVLKDVRRQPSSSPTFFHQSDKESDKSHSSPSDAAENIAVAGFEEFEEHYTKEEEVSTTVHDVHLEYESEESIHDKVIGPAVLETDERHSALVVDSDGANLSRSESCAPSTSLIDVEPKLEPTNEYSSFADAQEDINIAEDITDSKSFVDIKQENTSPKAIKDDVDNNHLQYSSHIDTEEPARSDGERENISFKGHDSKFHEIDIDQTSSDYYKEKKSTNNLLYEKSPFQMSEDSQSSGASDNKLHIDEMKECTSPEYSNPNAELENTGSRMDHIILENKYSSFITEEQLNTSKSFMEACEEARHGFDDSQDVDKQPPLPPSPPPPAPPEPPEDGDSLLKSSQFHTVSAINQGELFKADPTIQHDLDEISESGSDDYQVPWSPLSAHGDNEDVQESTKVDHDIEGEGLQSTSKKEELESTSHGSLKSSKDKERRSKHDHRKSDKRSDDRQRDKRDRSRDRQKDGHRSRKESSSSRKHDDKSVSSSSKHKESRDRKDSSSKSRHEKDRPHHKSDRRRDDREKSSSSRHKSHRSDEKYKHDKDRQRKEFNSSRHDDSEKNKNLEEKSRSSKSHSSSKDRDRKDKRHSDKRSDKDRDYKDKERKREREKESSKHVHKHKEEDKNKKSKSSSTCRQIGSRRSTDRDSSNGSSPSRLNQFTADSASSQEGNIGRDNNKDEESKSSGQGLSDSDSKSSDSSDQAGLQAASSSTSLPFKKRPLSDKSDDVDPEVFSCLNSSGKLILKIKKPKFEEKADRRAFKTVKRKHSKENLKSKHPRLSKEEERNHIDAIDRLPEMPDVKYFENEWPMKESDEAFISYVQKFEQKYKSSLLEARDYNSEDIKIDVAEYEGRTTKLALKLVPEEEALTVLTTIKSDKTDFMDVSNKMPSQKGQKKKDRVHPYNSFKQQIQKPAISTSLISQKSRRERKPNKRYSNDDFMSNFDIDDEFEEECEVEAPKPQSHYSSEVLIVKQKPDEKKKNDPDPSAQLPTKHTTCEEKLNTMKTVESVKKSSCTWNNDTYNSSSEDEEVAVANDSDLIGTALKNLMMESGLGGSEEGD